MYKYLILEIIGWALLAGAAVLILFRLGAWRWVRKKLFTGKKAFLGVGLVVLLLVAAGLVIYGRFPYPLHFAMPPTMHSAASDQNPPSLPLVNLWDFLTQSKKFERIDDIGADPNAVPAPITRKTPETVKISFTTKEVIAEVAKGIYNNYWTFNDQVPGPMLRVREGDMVEATITNDKSSLHSHNIDLHSVTGPGGGAVLTNVAPGETKAFAWKALAPGLYIYHCATSNVSVHNSHGQYGLILVEPKEGMAKVDKEVYIVQGELYTQGGIGKKGLLAFDPQALLDGNPTYVTFNGRIETTPRMKAKVGDRVRMYVGNGGVNLVSSFHVIGEIFDTVYPEAAMGPGSAVFKNVQSTIVPAGGATIVEFRLDAPGKYTLVDHALARMNKGAWAILEVEGDKQPDIIKPLGDSGKDPASSHTPAHSPY